MYGHYPWKFGRPSSNDMSVLTKRAQIFRAQKVLFRKYGSYIGLPWDFFFEIFDFGVDRLRMFWNVEKCKKLKFAKFFSYPKKGPLVEKISIFFLHFSAF